MEESGSFSSQGAEKLFLLSSSNGTGAKCRFRITKRKVAGFSRSRRVWPTFRMPIMPQDDSQDGRKGNGRRSARSGKSSFVLFHVRISGDVRLRLPRSFRFTRNWIIALNALCALSSICFSRDKGPRAPESSFQLCFPPSRRNTTA